MKNESKFVIYREAFQFWVKASWFSVAAQFITLVLGFYKLWYAALAIWAVCTVMSVRYIVLMMREIRKGGKQ